MPRHNLSTSAGFTLIELLIVVAIIGIIAAIAIPNLLRARVSANETQAIGDTRAVMSANVAYAASNCGYFPANLLCMTTEGGGAICIPGYPAQAPQFLAADLGRLGPYDKGGYSRDYPVSNVPASADPAICDAGSLLDYCYVAWPAQLGLTGVRSFLGAPVGAIFQEMGRERSSRAPLRQVRHCSSSLSRSCCDDFRARLSGLYVRMMTINAR